MINEMKLLTFVKAVEDKYYDGFIDDGEICMQTQKWFRNYESKDINIGDSSEGAKIVCGKGFLLFPEPIESFKTEELFLQSILDHMHNNENDESLIESSDFKLFDSSESINIFCLYSIYSSDFNQKKERSLVDDRFIKEFSNHRFLFITHPKEFLVRIENALLALGKKVETGQVKYYPQKDGFIFNLTPFHKPDKYSFQKEFRVAFKNEIDDKLILTIGSIRDICIEIDLDKKYLLTTINGFPVFKPVEKKQGITVSKKRYKL